MSWAQNVKNALSSRLGAAGDSALEAKPTLGYWPPWPYRSGRESEILQEARADAAGWESRVAEAAAAVDLFGARAEQQEYLERVAASSDPVAEQVWLVAGWEAHQELEAFFAEADARRAEPAPFDAVDPAAEEGPWPADVPDPPEAEWVVEPLESYLARHGVTRLDDAASDAPANAPAETGASEADATEAGESADGADVVEGWEL